MNMHGVSTDAAQLERLAKCLQKVIREQNLDIQRRQLQQLAARLNVGLTDCAAALLYLSRQSVANPSGQKNRGPAEYGKMHRLVRYRLDVGSQHNVAKEQIQALLIEESGVDKKRIGRIDIHPHYTLVELPDGMPADIFQLLSEAMIGERKLAIKRIKSNRRTTKN